MLTLGHCNLYVNLIPGTKAHSIHSVYTCLIYWPLIYKFTIELK